MSYAYLYCLNMSIICLFVLFTHESRAHDFLSNKFLCSFNNKLIKTLLLIMLCLYI
jgi:hypothetical protein